MKVEKLVEQRIEKHLELGEEPPKNDVKVINTLVENIPTVIDDNGNKDNDFQYARENLYDIIEKGRDAMEELLEIAKAEESPRAFEVFGQLLKNMTDTQQTLMELHQKKQKLENDGDRQEVSRAQNVTNALFVGSTADLLKLVKKETKQND
tara:strand:+ start:387 stop:839 length:453 start_codon:yes stop_codon:yes gene_type:complete